MFVGLAFVAVPASMGAAAPNQEPRHGADQGDPRRALSAAAPGSSGRESL